MSANLLLAALFLPLFPLSMAFNLIYEHLRGAAARVTLLVAWPQAGVALAYGGDASVPAWMVAAAVASAALYGLRALTLREVGRWTRFLATSSWSLLWLALATGQPEAMVHLYALAFSLPLALLALLGAALERRFGAAYGGLYGGLGGSLPRFSGVLAAVVLAAVATPLFPAFFIMLVLVLKAPPAAAVAVLGVWLLWSWAGARLLQGLVVGPGDDARTAPDLGEGATWSFGAALVALAAGGVYLAGAVL